MPKSILKPTDYKPDTTPLVTPGDSLYQLKMFLGLGYKRVEPAKPATDSTSRITQSLMAESAAVEVGEKKAVRFADEESLETVHETYHKDDYDRAYRDISKVVPATQTLYELSRFFKSKVDKELAEYKQNEMRVHPSRLKL